MDEPANRPAAWAADAILLVHFAFILFVVLGQAAVVVDLGAAGAGKEAPYIPTRRLGLNKGTPTTPAGQKTSAGCFSARRSARLQRKRHPE